jgi:hypothetical protein
MANAMNDLFRREKAGVGDVNHRRKAGLRR